MAKRHDAAYSDAGQFPAGVQQRGIKTLQAQRDSDLHLCDLAVSLFATAAAGRGPGEVGDGDDEEAVAAVQDTGHGVVPGGKGREETEEAAGLLDGGVGLAVDAAQVGDAEQQEGQVQEEEEQEEGDGGAQGAEDHEEGEDEPRLGRLVFFLFSFFFFFDSLCIFPCMISDEYD